MSLSLAKPAKALDPLTIVGAIASPIFCKLISCRSTETYIVQQSKAKKANIARLNQMKANFKWEVWDEPAPLVAETVGVNGLSSEN